MTHSVAIRVIHADKEITVTARKTEGAGMQVIDVNGELLARFDWLRGVDRPEINDWTVLFTGLSKAEANHEKDILLKSYLDKGYTVRTVKNYEDQ